MHQGAIVIGSSAGGIDALVKIIPKLPREFPVPVIIAQHISPISDNYIAEFLNNKSNIKVQEAEEKTKAEPGNAYIAPPNYHLLMERDKTFSLTTTERVNFARPSIDVLFKTAAEAYGKDLIGVILTGGNHDGASGMHYIQQLKGTTIVQEPSTAEVDIMPQSILNIIAPTKILPLDKIASYLISIMK